VRTVLLLVKTAGDGAVLVSRLPEEGAAITHGWDLDLRVTCCRPHRHLAAPASAAAAAAAAAAAGASGDIGRRLTMAGGAEGDPAEHARAPF